MRVRSLVYFSPLRKVATLQLNSVFHWCPLHLPHHVNLRKYSQSSINASISLSFSNSGFCCTVSFFVHQITSFTWIWMNLLAYSKALDERTDGKTIPQNRFCILRIIKKCDTPVNSKKYLVLLESKKYYHIFPSHHFNLIKHHRKTG